ncbi:PREDICTED: uncharacterized protein LOC108764666, partial [Trachymyrmex cornetzi]|uniref:uncharacterized protein LOC108764666 n=1 Tax=Trachymyrmex cornetzi TaxID=471704 RepID=UPI00084EE858
MPIVKKTNVINNTIPILNGIVSAPSALIIPYDKRLTTMEKNTINFISSHPDIIYTRADKGNATVAMSRETYINKMKTMLNDIDTYILIKKDPVRKLTTAVRTLLTRWKNKEYIDNKKYRFLYCSDGKLPCAYGVPKIHKQGYPLRIIISSIGSPLYPLANFLQNILSESLPTANSYIMNSFHLIEELKNIRIEDNFSLVSLDVVSLFTNVP